MHKKYGKIGTRGKVACPYFYVKNSGV